MAQGGCPRPTHTPTAPGTNPVGGRLPVSRVARRLAEDNQALRVHGLRRGRLYLPGRG